MQRAVAILKRYFILLVEAPSCQGFLAALGGRGTYVRQVAYRRDHAEKIEPRRFGTFRRSIDALSCRGDHPRGRPAAAVQPDDATPLDRRAQPLARYLGKPDAADASYTGAAPPGAAGG